MRLTGEATHHLCTYAAVLLKLFQCKISTYKNKWQIATHHNCKSNRILRTFTKNLGTSGTLHDLINETVTEINRLGNTLMPVDACLNGGISS